MDFPWCVIPDYACAGVSFIFTCTIACKQPMGGDHLDCCFWADFVWRRANHLSTYPYRIFFPSTCHIACVEQGKV